jgi:signal transduction histidine kinase
MENKIKNRFKLNVMLPAIIIYISFAISAVMGGISLGIYVLGIAMIILSFFVFYQYLRTKHFGSLISTIYLVIFGSFCISIHPYYEIGERLHMTQTSAILFVFAMILLVWLVYLNVTRKLKWRGREILELAAQNITDTYNNHTERPLPTGNVDFSREELYNFSKFFEKNLLGLTYKEDNRIVFMPLKYKNEYFALYNPNYNYKEKTWVSISNNGNVSVNISKQDYLDYKEDLAFEQLCSALSDIIIEFIELNISGREVRIIDKMDNLKISIFS